MASTTPIYLIEDHPLYREALASILRRLTHVQDVIELDRIGSLPLAVKSHGNPSAVFLDLTLNDTLGMSGIREIKHAFPDALLVALVDQATEEAERVCLEAGADAALSKTLSSGEVMATLRHMLAPEAEEVEVELSTTKLSKRQTQLLVALEQGLSNRDIADRLGISEHTVKVHLWRLFRRLGVKSRTQAIHTARLNGLIRA